MLAISVTPENPPVSQVQAVALPRTALTGGSLQPLGDAQGGLVAGKSAAQFVVRMSPVQGPGPASVKISVLDVMLKGGTGRAIAGSWTLAVAVPSNVTQLLEAQVLSGGISSAGGVSVSVASAVRSETETLVTVHLAGPAGVQFLGIPTLTCAGKLYQGRLLSSPGGSNLTYDFPATPMGEPATLTMRDAVAPSDAIGGYVDIDLGRAMARDGMTGKAGEQGILLPSDVVSTNAPAFVPTQIQFVNQGSFGAGVRITLGSALTPGQFGGARPNLILSDGTTIAAAGIGTGFDHDATGAIAGGHSDVLFLIPGSRVRGIVRVSIGSQDSVIAGSWKIGLTPSSQ